MKNSLGEELSPGHEIKLTFNGKKWTASREKVVKISETDSGMGDSPEEALRGLRRRSLGLPETDFDLTAESLARFFHATYERLAPEFNYSTRKASAVSWEDVPESNRSLMIATCREVLIEVGALRRD